VDQLIRGARVSVIVAKHWFTVAARAKSAILVSLITANCCRPGSCSTATAHQRALQAHLSEESNSIQLHVPHSSCLSLKALQAEYSRIS